MTDRETDFIHRLYTDPETISRKLSGQRVKGLT